MAQSMPEAEVEITEALVQTLLADQHPDLAEAPLQLVANGWDNTIYRVGSDLAVRLPRRRQAAQLAENEQRWLPMLARRLPLPISAPIRIGEPAAGFPWPWSVVPWFRGETAAIAPPTDGADAARQLGELLAALHQPAPPDAPENLYRGCPLAVRAEGFERHLSLLADTIDRPQITARWAEALDVAPWPTDDARWLHGDLHTANILTDEGRLAAIIDFGDITSGDPATDLAVGWMLFDGDDRKIMRGHAGAVDDDTCARAEAWALNFAVVYLANSADNPTMHSIGQRLLTTVLAEPAA